MVTFAHTVRQGNNGAVVGVAAADMRIQQVYDDIVSMKFLQVLFFI
jgi:hypothetical protein